MSVAQLEGDRFRRLKVDEPGRRNVEGVDIHVGAGSDSTADVVSREKGKVVGASIVTFIDFDELRGKKGRKEE